MSEPKKSRTSPISGHTIVRLNEASVMVGLCSKHIRTLERKGQFPVRVQLGPKSVGFRLMDLENWIDERRQEVVTCSTTKSER